MTNSELFYRIQCSNGNDYYCRTANGVMAICSALASENQHNIVTITLHGRCTDYCFRSYRVYANACCCICSWLERKFEAN